MNRKTYKKFIQLSSKLSALPPLGTSMRPTLHLGYDLLEKAKEILSLQEDIKMQKDVLDNLLERVQRQREYLQTLEGRYLRIDGELSDSIWKACDCLVAERKKMK